MEFEGDLQKSERNLRERGLDFAAAPAAFRDPDRKIWQDLRSDYGETRYNMLACDGGRVFFVTFTIRGRMVRIISFRKANARETSRYASL